MYVTVIIMRLKCTHHHVLHSPLSVGSVNWWYWILLIASAVISLTSLALWIALGVYVSMNGESYHHLTIAEILRTMNNIYVFVSDFVKGEDSGKWCQDNSLCETAAPNSVKNGLVIACFLFALLTVVEWVSCVIILSHTLFYCKVIYFVQYYTHSPTTILFASQEAQHFF